MGKYSVPQEIRDMKPNGSMVKLQSKRYYVYEYSSTKIKVLQEDGSFKWKTSTKMGKCIGQITLADGFIPNKNSVANDEITIKEYGAYKFVMGFSADTLETLKGTFNAKDSNVIYCIACIFVIEGFTYMKNINRIYQESFLSNQYPDVHMGYDALRNLFHNLGSRGGKINAFEQKLLDTSSKRIAIDGHVIACASSCNDLSAFGYKASKLGSEQINWMTAYDIDSKMPLANQMFNGADPDKTAVQSLFERFEFKGTLFVADRGFNTDADKKLMSENGNNFIIPMIQGRKDYQYVYGHLAFDKRKNFIYDKDGYSSLIYYREYLHEGRRYIAYKDTTRASAERQTYIKKVRSGKKGFTEEGLIENDKDFGLFILETSDKTKNPKEVFRDYKSRWSIETFYEYIDNEMDFNTIYQQDYYGMQGLGFIVQITGMIYHDLRKVLDEHNLSMKDVINELKGIKISKERGKWKVRNSTKQKKEICEKIGIRLPTTI